MKPEEWTEVQRRKSKRVHRLQKTPEGEEEESPGDQDEEFVHVSDAAPTNTEPKIENGGAPCVIL